MPNLIGLVPVLESSKFYNKDIFHLALGPEGRILPIFLSAPYSNNNLDLVQAVLLGTISRETGFRFERRDGFFVANPFLQKRQVSFLEMRNLSIQLSKKLIICFLFGLGGWNSKEIKKEVSELVRITEKYKFSVFINHLRLDDDGNHYNELYCYYQGGAYLLHEIKLQPL